MGGCMMYEEQMVLTLTRRELSEMMEYQNYCDMMSDADFLLFKVVDSLDAKVKDGENFLTFVDKKESFYKDDVMKNNHLTIYTASGKTNNGSNFLLKSEDIPKGFVDSPKDSIGIKVQKYERLCTPDDKIKFMIKLSNNDKKILEEDKDIMLKYLNQFCKKEMPYSKNLVVIDHKVLGKTENFSEQCFYRLSEIARWEAEGKLEGIENISYVFVPQNKEVIEIPLQNPEKLPSGDKEFYEETSLKQYPYRKNVILDGVLYTAVMSEAQYRAEQEGKLNLKQLSYRTTQFLSNLAHDWKKELSGVHLIQLNKVLCHNKADIKVMVDAKELSPEKSKYFAFDNGGWLRREKARFFQRNGIKIELFTLLSQKEYEMDMKVLNSGKQDLSMEDKKSKKMEKER